MDEKDITKAEELEYLRVELGDSINAYKAINYAAELLGDVQSFPIEDYQNLINIREVVDDLIAELKAKIEILKEDN